MHRAVGGPSVDAGMAKSTPKGSHIGAERLAQAVGADLADIAGPTSERGDAGHRVGRRTPGSLDFDLHHVVELVGPFLVDQQHRTLGQALPDDELIGGPGNDVDNGIADSDNVEAVVRVWIYHRNAPYMVTPIMAQARGSIPLWDHPRAWAVVSTQLHPLVLPQPGQAWQLPARCMVMPHCMQIGA